MPIVGAVSCAALAYVGYEMVQEDVQGRRGIFREDNLTDDATDAAKIAAGEDPGTEPLWRRQLRRSAATYAASQAGTLSEGGTGPANRADNPVVWLEFGVGEDAAAGAGLPSGGRVEVELRADVAPKTAENFRALCTGERPAVLLGPKASGKARRRVALTYAGAPVHRVIPGFMVQGGDIEFGTGVGGRSIYGHRFDDETFALRHGAAGAVAMANSGPGTNGSQFYVTLGNAPWLDGVHVVFGRVTAGMDVVEAMGVLGAADGAPSKPIRIVRAGQLPRKEKAAAGASG